MPEWNWFHIEHEPWTIISGGAQPPKVFPKFGKTPKNSFALVYEGDRCIYAKFDLSGLFTKWKKISRKAGGIGGDPRMVWMAETRFWRPSIEVNIQLNGREVFEYLPFEYPDAPRVRPFWGLALADTEVSIKRGNGNVRFKTDAILETMYAG